MTRPLVDPWAWHTMADELVNGPGGSPSVGALLDKVFWWLNERKVFSRDGRCVWSENKSEWWTRQCGGMASFGEGGPLADGMVFCSWCGRPITEAPYTEPEHEADHAMDQRHERMIEEEGR